MSAQAITIDSIRTSREGANPRSLVVKVMLSALVALAMVLGGTQIASAAPAAAVTDPNVGTISVDGVERSFEVVETSTGGQGITFSLAEGIRST